MSGTLEHFPFVFQDEWKMLQTRNGVSSPMRPSIAARTEQIQPGIGGSAVNRNMDQVISMSYAN
jgi:hypothetical protein